MADLFAKVDATYTMMRDNAALWSGEEVGLLWDEAALSLVGYGDQVPLRRQFDSMCRDTATSPVLAISSVWDVADLNRLLHMPTYWRYMPMFNAAILRRSSMVDPLDLPDFIARRAQPTTARGRHEIQGVVTGIPFAKNGFIVLSVVTPDSTYFTAVGNADIAAVRMGVTYLFMGRWTTHAKHGDRFTFDAIARDIPMTRQGISSYFKTTLAGIGFGPRSADKVWQKYGHEAISTIVSAPDRVSAETGLSVETLRRASEIISRDSFHLRTKVALHSLLSGRGFPRTCIDDCIKEWGMAAPEKIRHEPFLLLAARIPGAGFKRVDKLYCDLGLPTDNMVRQKWCAWNVVAGDRSGHTWLLRFEVRAGILEALTTDAAPDAAIDAAVAGGMLTQVQREGRNWLTTPERAQAEADLFDAILRLSSIPPTMWPDPDSLPILTNHQKDQLRTAFRSPVCILAGLPGTGKTTTSMTIVRALLDANLRVAVAAPTGKAAVRCTELLRKDTSESARTIHRLLGVHCTAEGWSFTFDAIRSLPYDVIIIDESSMLDMTLASKLLCACATGTHVLMVGDPYQLPPVGHGAPLRDMIYGGISTGMLTDIQRNGGRIAEACKNIREGKPFVTSPTYDPPYENLRHLNIYSPVEIIARLRSFIRMVIERKVFDSIDEVQIICAVNDTGDLSRNALNLIAQEELNPAGHSIDGCPFRVGDKIISLRNLMWPVVVPPDFAGYAQDSSSWHEVGEDVEEFVANGDMGKVLAVSIGTVVIKFSSPDRIVRVIVSDVSESLFDLGYVVTTHKFQGSQQEVVVVIIDPNPKAGHVTSREWVYTALSRAVKLCILLGDMNILLRWCEKQALIHRQTFLGHMLRESI